MSSRPAPNAALQPSSSAGLPHSLTLLMASGAGLAVASLYYSQPMLGVLGGEIGASTQAVGLLPTLTQLGYASGLLFLAPLGDRHDRRSIILGKSIVLCLALLLAASAPSLGVLLAASLVIGLAATLAQDIVPAAATLAPDSQRGKVVGMVMTGLLLGILLSRVVSGFVAEQWGWRVMFAGAAASIALLGLTAWRRLPRFAATTQLPYVALLGSLATLWRQHPALRRATVAQALLAVGFSGFWSTLAVLLHGAPFHLGAAAAGAFGLAGAAGALVAPVAGRLADRRGPVLVTRVGTGLVAASFAAMALMAFLPPGAQLWLLVACAIGFDLGLQAALIAHQTIVYGLDAGARGRINAVLFTGMFIGMALGSAAAALLFARWGWMGVTALATASALAAFALRMRR
ncbi:MFS transporter [Comamonas endophytica]|uniref:MFS transporter n=1 Tax=Comamonas endophytica TaxID=2949090 RepID=A0ABY6GA91_9BURK|nr:MULTISPECIES: MFS transporter [unclassified Acidovorax]MCD2512036.1 MFS transporter [Acidovorax sp. D4N7]UYG51816.1 MFS transporter [Acidovorax sp. 5MLIR]